MVKENATEWTQVILKLNMEAMHFKKCTRKYNVTKYVEILFSYVHMYIMIQHCNL